MCLEKQNIWVTWCAPSQWSQTRWLSAFLFQLSYSKQVSSLWSIKYPVLFCFTFLCFWLKYLNIVYFKYSLSIVLKCFLFKIFPEHSAKVFSSVPKDKIVTCLWRNYVLDKFSLGMSYGAIDCDFNGNESTIYIK